LLIHIGQDRVGLGAGQRDALPFTYLGIRSSGVLGFYRLLKWGWRWRGFSFNGRRYDWRTNHLRSRRSLALRRRRGGHFARRLRIQRDYLRSGTSGILKLIEPLVSQVHQRALRFSVV